VTAFFLLVPSSFCLSAWEKETILPAKHGRSPRRGEDKDGLSVYGCPFPIQAEELGEDLVF
jgi:hypothetical protein